ncbi:hexapeptide repeat-containing transferase [Clostridium pasteurianum DSM 525 = ATCC 6013]|uniref:Hexapeptide repeat-containing transferase n=1 Tax=Clostridium pasteurianum DSM 525 = ATCC 6013 TaxID=1262449 RepID=A0A0H3J5V1_CLOPA|nr:acyltransferase [Clostridium pasteurianum]AJA48829.1 hexapeptide repeat-containing transferase [Clostridium pasteurianum DSM 525 = ATCC 6013]AJA52817.1 hexapeptide repeat-containing transferase [Clostridium pasteurianum DSM 525 = ATCC 6013]AOZ76041.1 transferase [Clostridium pasteurianum DSM 525 = ATCC 6013]AOZ79837.1 transferase [Clostridium pasteurianum]KRU11175.1 transferase hexapeptide repeat containing protein [Clostridium pasteurianum DSM 525 = ATCC 6013]
MNKIDDLLIQMENIIQKDLNKEGVIHILNILKCSFPFEILDEIQLYGDYLPKNKEIGFSEEKRYLHFLWDALDKSPMCLIANFAIPFRAILANKLFKSCGKNFICEENVRFNVPDNMEIGDNVFINKGTLIDAKGGLIVGNSVGIGEGVTIFTHSHAEHDHSLRTYAPVIIKDYAKIYSNSTILPDTTIGEQSIVAACSLVNKNVAPNSLVAGMPAKHIRDRKTFDNTRDRLGHVWLYNGEFQKEESSQKK